MKIWKCVSSICTLSIFINLVLPVCSVAETIKGENTALPEGVLIDEEISKAFEDGIEKVPAVIWYKPLDQSTVEEIVFERTGLTIENIDIPFIQPPMELLAELDKETNGNNSDNLSQLMETYLRNTKEERKIEKELSERYSNERRKVVEELIYNSSQNIISQIGLNEEQVIFKSKYAPMILAEITFEDAENISNNNEIKSIDYYKKMEIVECAYENATYRSTMNVNSISNTLGLTGDGVKIGIYETSTVPFYPTNQTNLYHVNTDHVTLLTDEVYASTSPYHAIMCAGVAAGDYGIAPDADIYTASIEDDWYNYSVNPSNPLPTGSVLESLIDAGVKVVNVSFAGSDGGSAYSIMEKWIDSIITSHLITVVVATNNNYEYPVSIPSGAFNVISVNGFFKNNNNVELLNSYSYSSRGCYKPDVIADSSNMGTSLATPVISGMIALLFEFKPSLANYPQATKAILMASCHRKMSQRFDNFTNNIYDIYEQMDDGLSDHQGTGVPDMYKMISITAQHNYGVCEVSSTNKYINIVQPSYGASNINFSMAYLQTNASYTNSELFCDDYDLYITNNNTTSSAEWYSSTEMVYRSLSSNPNYTLRIHKYSGTSASIGYAWSTNDIRYFSNNDEEGIYFIRNANSDKMIYMNTSDLNIYQNPISFNDNYMWILKKNPSGQNYTLKNGATYDYGVIKGSAYNNNNYYATGNNISSISPVSILVDNISATNGTSRLVLPGQTNYFMQILGNSTSDNAQVMWGTLSTASSARWYLERISYLSGDVNKDGCISSTDGQWISEYLLNLRTFNNIELYLADANKDDTVDMADAVWIYTHNLPSP